MEKVYVKTDTHGRIVRCEGGYTTPLDLAGWALIDEGAGDKYNLCQTHYFPGGLTRHDGTHRYIYAPDLSPAYREATAEELEAERAEIEAARVPVGPTPEQIMQQQITDLELQGFEQGQAITNLELQALEQGQALTDYDLKNIESNQKITDMELSDIENGQKATDLEIKVLELMENVRQYQGAI